MSEKQPDAALRIWLDTPNLMMSYGRSGIVVVTVALRQEAAKAAVTKFGEMLLEYGAPKAEDLDGAKTLTEILDMTREALKGGPGQLLPLDGEEAFPFDDLFGEVS